MALHRRIAFVASAALAFTALATSAVHASSSDLKISNTSVWQKSSTGVYTSGTVTLKTKNTGARKNSVIKLNPLGTVSSTGKTQRKEVKLHWNSNKKAYVGTYKFATKAPGKISVTAYANSATYNCTKSHSKLSTPVYGVNPTSTTLPAHKVIKDTIKVAKSARGRTVLVQYKSGSSWKTYKSYKLSSTQSTQAKTITLKAPAAGKSLKYRIYVTGTKFAQQSTVHYRTLAGK